MNELKMVIKNAIHKALKIDGYNQVVIKDKDGDYSFNRKYDGCCPAWCGEIVGEIVTYWENGILKAKYVEHLKGSYHYEYI